MICFEMIQLFALRSSIIDGLKTGRDNGVPMNTHNGFTIFTYQHGGAAFDAFDNIDGSLSLVPEFVARFYNEDTFLYHGCTLSKSECFAKIFIVSNKSQRKS